MITAAEMSHVLVPAELEADLRTDHAGEYGAVAIYNGILATTRSSELRDFALNHRETEEQHLQLMEQLVPLGSRSRLLSIWRLSGWILGALPATIGPHATFVTIAAVEQYVEKHYQAQIARIGTDKALAPLRSILASCCEDEVAHKNDANSRLKRPNGWAEKLWRIVVGAGSALAVGLARRV